MRMYAVVAAALTLCSGSSAFAQQSASYEACFALSEERGAGVGGPGQRNHNEFMTECLAGKVPLTVGGPAPTPASAEHVQSYNKCFALSEQRGAGVGGPGQRNHSEFMRECMAGRIQ
jgi:hypothetical protein